MKIYKCVYRIYVNTKEPYCPAPEWLVVACEEGAEMLCPHYTKTVLRLADKETDYPPEIMDFVRKIAKILSEKLAQEEISYE